MANKSSSVALIIFLSFVSLPVTAQNSGRGQAVRVAQKLFEKGATAYTEQRYGEAFTYWRKAYTYVPAAVFLYNAAKAAEKLKNLDQAVGLAKRAQAQKKKGLSAKLKRKNAALIDRLEKRIKARRHRRKTAPMQWSWVGYSGAGAAVVGLGLIGGSLLMGGSASSQIQGLDDVEQHQVYQRRREEIEAKQATGRVMLYSGVGLAAAGTGVVLWDLLAPGESPLRVRAGTGGADVGATVEWKF